MPLPRLPTHRLRSCTVTLSPGSTFKIHVPRCACERTGTKMRGLHLPRVSFKSQKFKIGFPCLLFVPCLSSSFLCFPFSRFLLSRRLCAIVKVWSLHTVRLTVTVPPGAAAASHEVGQQQPAAAASPQDAQMPCRPRITLQQLQ